MLLSAAVGVIAAATVASAKEGAAKSRFVDPSLLVAPEYPCAWPSHPFPRFSITHERNIGPDSPHNIDVLLIDGITGTQVDTTPHSVTRPDLKREKSGPLGLGVFSKRIQVVAWIGWVLFMPPAYAEPNR